MVRVFCILRRKKLKKIHNKQQIKELSIYPIEVLATIKDIVLVLDESYGKDRDIEINLGGYVLIVETAADIKELKDNILKGMVAEYTDIIRCGEGVNYTSSLFLVSNDYSIVVIATYELSKFLIE